MAIWLVRLAIDRWRQSESCEEGQGTDVEPLVLITETAHGLRIDAANRGGLEAGARPGMMLADARTLCPVLKAVPSDPAGDLAFLERKKCVLGRLRGDMDYPAAQRFGQSGPIGPSAQPDGCGILDPQHAAFVRQPRTHPVERQRERRCRTPGFPARSEDLAVTRELSALGEPRSPARDASAERGQLAGCGQVRKVHPESTPMFYLCSNLPFMAICRARLSLHRAEPEHVPPAPVAPARRNR